MKYDGFIRKLKKRLKTETLDLSVTSWGANGRKEWLVHDGTVASWRVEKDSYREGQPLVVSGFHTKGVGQESDPQTDYFPGTFWSNATQLVDRLCPPPAKYPAGTLVRGKDNKRAHRFGYAGKHALVTQSTGGHYFSLQFIGTETKPGAYNNSYPMRDFELVKNV